MIRFTFVQSRATALVAAVGLGIVAIVLAITGPHLVNVNDAFENVCKAAGACGTTSNPVLDVDSFLQSALPFLVTVVPALIGLFLGAPLIARELESGTFRLAWTQSITRGRWLAAKLGLVGVGAMATAGVLTWMANWWSSPLDAVNQNRFDPANFGTHGIAPIGYAAFAFALGVTAGALFRRTLPAMAVTLVGFVAARLAVEYRVRPYLASPLHKSLSILSTGFGNLGLSQPAGTFTLIPPRETIPNGWRMSTALLDRSGHALTSRGFLNACPAYRQFPPSPATMQSAHDACVAKLATVFHTVVTYQPGSRFWPFQWAEMGIFIAAALALCGVTYLWLRRQYS